MNRLTFYVEKELFMIDIQKVIMYLFYVNAIQNIYNYSTAFYDFFF